MKGDHLVAFLVLVPYPFFKGKAEDGVVILVLQVRLFTVTIFNTYYFKSTNIAKTATEIISIQSTLNKNRLKEFCVYFRKNLSTNKNPKALTMPDGAPKYKAITGQPVYK